ncbi:hypothetical protein RJZ56_005621 [Blastomyces dermatitidis]
MADNSSPDYEALYRKAEAERRQEAELRRQAEELRRQAEERESQEAELRRQAEEREAREKVRSQPTTLEELIKGGHDSFSRPLQVGTPSRFMKGSIPLLTGKYCSTSLCFWSNCPAQLQEIYDAVSTYLQSTGRDAPRLFTSLLVLNELVKYKLPHKLSVENLRAGLQSMELWEEIVQSDTILKSDELNKDEKLRYNVEQLTCSVLIQKYHVMIQAGLEYSYITNGFAIILLCVSYSDPSTLYYYLCESNMDVISENPEIFYQSKTAIARILCLCLMSFLSDICDQKWRNAARSQLHIWKTSFDFTQLQIPDDKLQQTSPGSEYASSEYMPSEHLPSSSLQPSHGLDCDLDHNYTLFGTCGSYDAPFKITCAAYGYTLVGKGTTAGLWKVVSHEAEIYWVLQKAQGSAVPVFLGTIDLKLILFLHGAEDIHHMLLMGWAGESIENVKDKEVLSHEISKSKKEIRMLGVVHKDLQPVNMLWNYKLCRVLIIDFHRSDIDRRLMKKQVGFLKRPLPQTGMSKRPCNNNGWTGRISGPQSSAGVIKQR